MDLPSCPACGQSVLDDDAEHCPFCGASMSGKGPARKPAVPATAKPAAAKPAGASGKPAGAVEKAAASGKPAAKKSPAEAAEDDPFAVDSSAAQKAIPLKPRPEKGRTLEVVCPMCEKKGYAPPKAAGHDVRCVNPNCLVPIFTAPAPVEKPPEAPKKGGGGKLIPIAVVLFVLISSGTGVWYFLFAPKVPTSLPPVNRSELKTAVIDEPEEQESISPKVASESDAQNAAAAATLTVGSLKGQVGAFSVDASQRRDRNRSRPYCWWLTTENFARMGDLEQARKYLDVLAKSQPRIPHYQIRPLAEIGWQQLGSENKADAAAAQEAWALRSELPKLGRVRLEAAVPLASLLVATNRTKDALTLIGEQSDPTTTGQLAALLVIGRSAQDFRLMDEERPIHPWMSPQAVAVTWDLVIRDQIDLALQWAEQQPSLEARSECLAAFAAAVVFLQTDRGLPSAIARIQPAAEKQPAAAKIRMLATAARRLQAHGESADADKLLSAAHAALQGLTPEKPYLMPDMPAILKSNLADPTSARSAALAAGEVARVELGRGNPAGAWDLILKGQEFVRSTAPSQAAVKKRTDQFIDIGAGGVQAELKSALGITSDDEARLKMVDYRSRLNGLEKAAVERFQLQTSIMGLATGGEIDPQQVWDFLESQHRERNLDARELYLTTDLPWRFAESIQERDSDLATKMRQTARNVGSRSSVEFDFEIQAARLLADGNVTELVKQLEESRAEKYAREMWLLTTVARRAQSEDPAPLLAMLRRIEKSPDLRDDALAILAVQAARAGRIEFVWENAQKRVLQPTEAVALCSGLTLYLTSPELNDESPIRQGE